MEESKTIKIARRRNYGFIVNYNSDTGMRRTYEWSGSKGDQVDIKEIPEEVVQYLTMNTTAFIDGELAIVDESELAEEIKSNITEGFESNTHSREEIIKILNGSMKNMKAEFDKITSKEEFAFIIDIAKSIDLDSSTKRTYLAEKVNMAKHEDILFDKES